MRNILSIITVSLFLSLSGSGCNTIVKPKLNLMVVAGGHNFDTLEFVEMFRDFSNFTFDTVMQPRANRMIAEGKADLYDVLVFYDMWPDLDSAEKAGYYRLLDRGKGMVFLHHSIVSYQDWDEFQNIIGGKYWKPAPGLDSTRFSGYAHDLDLDIQVVRSDHPVTRGVKNFSIRDEGYSNISTKSDAMLVLRTEHPECSENIGWVNTYGNSMIVYLMLGHDKNAYQNEQYRTLLKNAIIFVNKQK